MKKINLVLQFFSKKGVLLIGIVIGILLAFVMANYAVHAEETTEESAEIPEEKVYAGTITWTDIWTDGNGVGASILNDVKGSGKVCLYYTGGTDGTSNSGFILMSEEKFTCTLFNPVYNTITSKESYLYSGKYQIYDAGMVTSFSSSGFLLFSDREKAFSYIDGTISEEDLKKYSNYDSWKEEQRESVYDKAIPIPDDFGFSNCDSKGIQVVWKYTDSESLTYNNYPLMYDVQVEYLYTSMSATSGFLFGYTGSTGLQGGSVDSAIGNLKTVEATHTVEEYLTTGESLVNNLLKAESIDKNYGPMTLVNTFSGVPKDYKSQFVSSGNPFFSGATNSTHPIFIGAQATVTPYYIDAEGIRHNGNDSVTRKFVNGITSAVSGGNTTVVVGTDGEGNKYYESEYTPSYEAGSGLGGIGSLDGEGLGNYVKNGFGLLGNNGFLALAQRMIGIFPSEIWVLILFALGVSLTLMIGKVIRGM